MAHFDWSFRPNLTIKLVLIIVGVSMVNSTLIMRQAEHQLERVILDQVVKQAHAFLHDIAIRIQEERLAIGSPDLAALLKETKIRSRHLGADFSVQSFYIYDTSGKVRAHSEPGQQSDKSLSGKYGDVLRTASPYIGQEVETEREEESGALHSVLDIILPVISEGRVVGGLEAELDMDETMIRIGQADDQSERDLAWILSIQGVVMALLLWLLINRVLVRPIRMLDNVTTAIARGDLGSRFTDRPPRDEIGRLSGSVNQMADSIETLIREQEEAYMQALRSLMQALEVKDGYTAAHSSRVSRYSVMLGKRIGLSEELLELLRKGALMHDLGKIGIPDAVLNKPMALTDAEFAAMRSHPEHTATIMRPLKRFKEFAEIAAWHHERWDGTGYPDGLREEGIPLLARVVSIADTWDAMTGDRVYRKGMPKEKALAILRAERDSGQWDPHLLGIFIDMVGEQIG